MPTSQAPSGPELVGRAAELVPLLREQAARSAAWTEEHRRLPAGTLEAMAGAGLLAMRLPARHGGYESAAQTLVEVATELGRGDGSAAWAASVWWISGWLAGLFPEAAQREVFGTPGVRVAGTLNPGGTAVAARGGVLLTGRWAAVGGAADSHWQQLVAMSAAPDGTPEPIAALVPAAALAVVAEPRTTGPAGTGLPGAGGTCTVAREVFVPRERVLPLAALLPGRGGGPAIYRAPLLAVAAASCVGSVIGLARGALDALPEPGHPAAVRAAALADRAEHHGHRIASLVDATGVTGQPWTVAERARTRVDLGSVCRLAKDAVDLLATAGAPVQRIARDLHAATLHALRYPYSNVELAVDERIPSAV